MAKVTGPLFSQDAAGLVAGCLTFRSGKAPQTCRSHFPKPITPSEAQTIHRAAFAMLAAAWSNASPADKLSWVPLTAANDLSPYGAYLRFNFQRIADGLSTTTVYPPIELPSYPITITAATPDLFPDCTGDYEQIGTQNNEPMYARVSDAAYILFCTSTSPPYPWRIQLVGDTWTYWDRSPGPPGVYLPRYDGEGSALVTVN